MFGYPFRLYFALSDNTSEETYNRISDGVGQKGWQSSYNGKALPPGTYIGWTLVDDADFIRQDLARFTATIAPNATIVVDRL